jgi:hypothetical protein
MDLLHFSPDTDRIRFKKCPQNLLSGKEFRGNLSKERHTLRTNVKELLLLFSEFIDGFLGEIRHRRSTHNAA